MRKGSIEISIYQPLTPHRVDTTDRRARALTCLLVAALTLALHILFISAVQWGLGAGYARSPASTPRFREDMDTGTAAMEWIDLGQNAEGDEGAPGDHDIEPTLQQVALSELPAPMTMNDPNEAAEQSSDAEGAGRSQLYGRYLGQIDARIERAWLRPRTPIGARSFSCTAEIEQDETGHILEIILVRCNGTIRWQQSLVRAIQAASPLPAPPDPKVFRRHITLSFQGQAYSAASNPYLYEP